MRHCLVILFFTTLCAAIKFPEYSISQLNDAAFVKAEIEKYRGVRDKLQKEIETAPPIVQLTLREDVKKTECLLEALQYVEGHGLKLDDPGLGKLSFFQKVPVGSAILLPKPQVRTSARVSTSQASGSAARPTTGAAAAVPEVTETSADTTEVPPGISHGDEIDLKDYLVKGQTVVFEFYSQYCAPCRQIAPLLELLDQKRPDLTVVKVDINRPSVSGIDWQSPVARQFELQSVPHFKIFAPDGTLQAEGQAGYAVVALLLEQTGIGAAR